LSLLPREYHPKLWQAKIIFLSGSGASNLQPGTFTIKQDDPLLQSHVYLMLAQASLTTEDQLQWYDRSIKVLIHYYHLYELSCDFSFKLKHKPTHRH